MTNDQDTDLPTEPAADHDASSIATENPSSADPVQVTPPRKARRWPWLVGIAAAGILGLIVGSAAAGSAEPEIRTVTVTEDPTEEREAELQQRALELDGWQNDLTELEVELEDREKDLDAREEAIGIAEEEAAANSVGDGVWTVGVDIEPGTYRATDVSDDCYWAILVTGSNGSDIVENDIPGGGNPTVTLQEGWDFESSRCGEWRRQ